MAYSRNNGNGIADGDKGDITVSGSGSTAGAGRTSRTWKGSVMKYKTLD